METFTSFYKGLRWTFGSGIKVFQPTINRRVASFGADRSVSEIINICFEMFQTDIDSVPIIFRHEIRYRLSFMVLDAVKEETEKMRIKNLI